MKHMEENELLVAVQEHLQAVFQDIPFAEVKRWSQSKPLAGILPDLVFNVQAGSRRWKMIVEVKSIGEPRQLRYAIQQLKEYLQGMENGYGIIGAPYISEDGARICRDNGVGCIDLAGNCLLSFDEVHIERTGYPNPSTDKRSIRSPFTRKASRVIRVMLTNPNRSWQLQELAKKADISLGLASKVKRRLLDLEYARENDKKEILFNHPRDVLEKWKESYTFRKNSIWNFFSPDEPEVLERRLAGHCSRQRIRYALTLFSGAALVAPFTHYTRGFSYVDSDIRKVAEAIELKEVSSGPNFTILESYDEGVFFGAREIEGTTVVSDIQLYLDLVSYRGRGEEAAQFLLENRIAPTWES